MSLRLNSRCLNILGLLVESEQPLAAGEIAGQLNISARMVRTSLASATGWLQDGQFILKKVPGVGFSIAGSEKERRRLARKIRDYDNPLAWLSSTERLQVLLLTLFFTDKPLQIKQLQHALNLSRTTTLHELKSTENWLREYRLELIRRSNYGCMITGDERAWRKAVISLLKESTDDAQLLTLCQGMKTLVDISSRKKTGLEDVLQKVWMLLDMTLIRALISPIEHNFEGALSDQTFINFFIYLAIAIYRNRIGKKISVFPEISKHPSSQHQLSEANKLSARAQTLLGIHLSEAEISWISLQIPETRPLLPVSLRVTARSIVDSDPTIQNAIEQFLNQASLSLHPSLNVDEDLIDNLTILLEDMLDSQHGGQDSKKPLLQEVKIKYPYFFSVARQSSRALADRIGRELNESEIGEIAICLIASMERMRLLDRSNRKVLVVCSAGVVTAWLLVSRLRAEFPDIEVVEVISALELENRNHFEGNDFIVSTIPLKIKDIPSCQVNPLLGVEDIKCLKKLFEKPRNFVSDNILNPLSTIHLSDLLRVDTIEVGVVAKTWHEVVEKAGAGLLEAGAIEPHFIRAMKNIIQEFGPYMVIWPGAVLLHAPPQGVKRLCMELITLREPVQFGHPKNDPVQVAVILGAVDNRSHITALLELNQLMQDEIAMSSIRNTFHKSAILHWVSRYSNSTIL
jgi:transcriptional antiterminator/mannitol/fructose-specific phosphotransferase system IIA component (Ntr-type)